MVPPPHRAIHCADDLCLAWIRASPAHARISREAQVRLVDAPLARGDVMLRIIAQASASHTGSVAHDAELLVAVDSSFVG